MPPIAMNMRKRPRSPDYDTHFEMQSKQFINDKIVNQNDTDKMKHIHEKTLELMFKNSKTTAYQNNGIGMGEQPITNNQQFGENVYLLGDGLFKYIGNSTNRTPAPNASRSCKNCGKTSSLIAADCSNCNLELCEHCGVSCMQCNVPLCMPCVRLFECCDNTMEANPCCQRCKIYQ